MTKKNYTKQDELNYKFPKWVTRDMKINFFDMWKCFKRVPADYYENPSTQLNNKKCTAPIIIGAEKADGIYYHKWNNIGWIYDGEKVHTVYNAKKLRITPKGK